MTFITTQNILEQSNAIADRSQLASYLETCDIALDGKRDGGFFAAQVRDGINLTVDHPLAADIKQTDQVHRRIQGLARAQLAQAEKPVSEDSVFLAGGKILLAIVLFPALLFSGCAEDPECPEECDNSTDHNLCYETEEGEVECGCKPGKQMKQCRSTSYAPNDGYNANQYYWCCRSLEDYCSNGICQ